MNAGLLHLAAFYGVVIGWIASAAVFVFRTRGCFAQPRMANRVSIAGMVVQSISFVLIWAGGRSVSRLVLPQSRVFQFLLGLVAIALVASSFWIITAAVQALGKQWSIQARVLEDHQLIQHGPYRIVRHPIYTGLLGLLLATGIVWTDWLLFIMSLCFFAVGSAIRIRSEEKLLQEQFRGEFDVYRQSVPAVVPLKWWS